MRYTVEFEISPDVPKEQLDRYIEYNKRNSDCELGALIHKIVGWTGPIGYSGDRYKMQIQAFEQRDWEDFKWEIRNYLAEIDKSGIPLVSKLFHKLEEIGSQPIDPSSVENNNNKQC